MSRSNEVITFEDGDRNIDFTVSVDYDWLPEGAVEHPTVKEVISAKVWFGDYAADLDLGDNAKQIAAEIEGKYGVEIIENVIDTRQHRMEAGWEDFES